MYYYHIISSRANCKVSRMRARIKAIIWRNENTPAGTISIGLSGIFGSLSFQSSYTLQRVFFSPLIFRRLEIVIIRRHLFVSLSLSLICPPPLFLACFVSGLVYGAAKTVKSCTWSQISYLEFLTARSNIISWRLPWWRRSLFRARCVCRSRSRTFSLPLTRVSGCINRDATSGNFLTKMSDLLLIENHATLVHSF